MRRHLTLVLGGVLFASAGISATIRTGEADDGANPYQNIIERNVFALKPPPPPPDPEATKPPPSKITLTGITTILGNKRALMKAPPPPGKPGEAAKAELSFILTEGQRDGAIEVLQIDEAAGSVKVSNAGVIETLTFEKNGAKLPSTAPPGAPALPGAAPGMAPGFGAPGSTTVPGNFTLPSRTLRSGNDAQGQNASGTGIPGVGQAGSNAQTSQQRSAEENALLYEANRLKNEQLIQSGVRMPRLPQHPLASGLDQQGQQQAPVQAPQQPPQLPFAPGVVGGAPQ